MPPLPRRILAVILGASIALAQQTSTPAAPDPAVFRSTTRLVQVNVVVHNRKGEAVADLKKEDFSLTEKGKPQQIAVFSVQSTGTLPNTPVKLPPHIFSNRLSDRSSVPANVTVILLDALNTSWADQAYSRQQVIKFLQQVQPGDHIALYQLGKSLKILHDYTTDASELLAKMAKYRGDALPDVETSESKNAGFDLEAVTGSFAEADFVMANRVVNTLKAIEMISNHLASVQGRKNLVWVSGGFPLMMGFDEIPDIGGPIRDRRTFTIEMDSAIRALNNANVAVYPVDARGLVVGGGFSAENRTAKKKSTFGPTVPYLDTMSELADRTGGKAYFNTNDLKNAIRNAIDDSVVTYTLGYYPSEGELDGKFREVRVRVNRPGANIRYRKGYFAIKPAAQDDKARKDEIRGAVWGPLDATALPLNVRVDFIDKPQPNTVNVIVQIDTTALALEQKADRWTGKLDLIFVQKDEQGHVLAQGIAATLDMNMTRQTYLTTLQKGLIYRKAFPREANARAVRVVVRDASSGLVGSLTVPFSQIN
jgi:VWFA-related protein